jgi:hypothetical protein
MDPFLRPPVHEVKSSLASLAIEVTRMRAHIDTSRCWYPVAYNLGTAIFVKTGLGVLYLNYILSESRVQCSEVPFMWSFLPGNVDIKARRPICLVHESEVTPKVISQGWKVSRSCGRYSI